ncbi:granzyme M-like [Phlebotomus papatasi]|uniref:granzyme M-like n=1 Tax=Phlebotomus papatasi TaxID=29031 RepID=UPI0024846F98|nr:granzyme M-like [Phlebotomus papatasi]
MKIIEVCYLIFLSFFRMSLAIFGGENSGEAFVCLCNRVDRDIDSGALNSEDYVGVVTVLNEKWVITASDRVIANDVLPNVDTSYLEVLCGPNEYVSSMYDLGLISTILDTSGINENLQARRIIRYEYLQPYGLVLLELDENLNGDAVINPISLPPSSSYSPAGIRTIIGWEDQNYLLFTAKIKKKAEIEILDIGNCMSGNNQISETNIRLELQDCGTSGMLSCVNNPSPSITTCNVDSGSPIVDFTSNPPILVGIAMWNNRICNQDYIGLPVTTAVNMNMDTIINWIQEITGS